MDEKKKLEEAMELGAWLGRKQAFSGMAGRCSAADAYCILKLREGKKYKAASLTWEEFCSQRLGVSRSLADRTIRLLEEFGETYFHLTGLIPMAPEDYRLIAASVSADGVQHGGETVPIAPQNAVKLAEAVKNLKQQARLALPAPAPAAEPAAAKLPADLVSRTVGQLQDAVVGLERLLADGPGCHDRSALMTVLGGASERLGRLNRSLRA
ncbi:MAG TPA: hypothetical protein VKF41_05600 [Bryobacteraceae bacterium]|nr:hypothetical protein [Bryobacteraceae bacterium]